MSTKQQACIKDLLREMAEIAAKHYGVPQQARKEDAEKLIQKWIAVLRGRRA